jgi:hypothetical protein
MAVVLPSRVFRRLKRGLRGLVRKTAAHLCSTYPPRQDKDTGRLAQRFAFMVVDFVRRLSQEFPDYPPLVLAQTEQALAHCFDLLGSGPVVVKHGMQCAGVGGVLYPPSVISTVKRPGFGVNINGSNRSTARYVGSLVDDAYSPIDWQLDFKSGYRWREDAWHGDIRFGHLRGVDVKVPWELARMQHLPALAMAAHFSRCGLPGFRQSEIYAGEFRNQVLDFIASNPPGFGVNWACPMDIAIRVANWLVARDMFVASGVVFDDDFESIFMASVTAHASHIASNLEWAPQIRGNHYLADIAGLLLAAVYLPSSAEVDAWLAFSVQELIEETHYQFHEDGSNFEASVCYHRLSSEIVLWAAAFLATLNPTQKDVLKSGKHHPWSATPKLKNSPIVFYPLPGGQGESPLPDSFWSRLRGMAQFSEAMTRPDGTVVQFGDNDSGRFMTVGSGEQLRAANDPASPRWSLDHGALTAGIHAVLGLNSEAQQVKFDVAATILCALVGNRPSGKPAPDSQTTLLARNCAVGDAPTWQALYERFTAVPVACRRTSVFEVSAEGLLDEVEFKAFRGMGCYIVRSPRLYLAIRCGEIGLAGLGAHAHCDQLAIELVMDGESKARDPGTYTYTAFPDKRNLYRSALAHHVPRVMGKEPAKLSQGVFNLRGAPQGECLYFGPHGFVGRHAGYGAWVYRMVALEGGRIVIHDFSESGLQITDPTPAPLPYSQAYGRLMELV